jgi:hypothetical protein
MQPVQPSGSPSELASFDPRIARASSGSNASRLAGWPVTESAPTRP